MPCAFTGKAAYRLEQKGLFGAQTIHRTIYDYDGHKFHKKPYVDGDWFLIDEGSMVSTDLWVDLLSYGKPIIMLGDPGQLEPVGKDPRLMHKADVVLDKIHRQAAESGIIQFATYVRLGKVLEHDHSDEVDIYHGENPTVKDLKWADIILCGFNHTRIKLNRVIRGTRAFGGLLNSGEKIIILKNNPNFGVFNGQILTVKRIISNGRRLITCDCLVDDGRQVSLPLYKEQFGSKLVDFKKISSDSQKIVLADYGYCITTHKSQGSEWDKVLVIDEQCQIWDSKRWRYTAITRAAVELKYYFK
jgi:exodeoxyribonuclease-5